MLSECDIPELACDDECCSCDEPATMIVVRKVAYGFDVEHARDCGAFKNARRGRLGSLYSLCRGHWLRYTN